MVDFSNTVGAPNYSQGLLNWFGGGQQQQRPQPQGQQPNVGGLAQLLQRFAPNVAQQAPQVPGAPMNISPANYGDGGGASSLIPSGMGPLY
jgi:hypothetical protein